MGLRDALLLTIGLSFGFGMGMLTALVVVTVSTSSDGAPAAAPEQAAPLMPMQPLPPEPTAGHMVLLDSVPEGAAVWASSGEYLGTTPLYLEPARGHADRFLTVRFDGYQTMQTEISSQPNQHVLLHLTPLMARRQSRWRGRPHDDFVDPWGGY